MSPTNELEKWDRLSRIERLGERLVRMQVLKLHQLTELIEEQQRTPHKKLGELAVERGLITQDELMRFLMDQFREGQTIDESLRELGQMTQEEKWERMAQHERLGVMLVKYGNIKLTQMMDAIAEQERNPEKRLGDVVVERGLITPADLDRILALQKQQSTTLWETVNEVRSTPTKDA